jgi:hypothetical protein
MERRRGTCDDGRFSPSIQLWARRYSATVPLSDLFEQFEGHAVMETSAILRLLVGPYGLHAMGFVVMSLFLAFLWVFNFTTFFGGLTLTTH